MQLLAISPQTTTSQSGDAVTNFLGISKKNFWLPNRHSKTVNLSRKPLLVLACPRQFWGGNENICGSGSDSAGIPFDRNFESSPSHPEPPTPETKGHASGSRKFQEGLGLRTSKVTEFPDLLPKICI